MRRSPRLAALLAPLVVGCASGRGGPASAPIADQSAGFPTEGVLVVSGVTSTRVPIASDAPGTAERAVAGPPDSVFHALVDAYEAAGLAPNVVVGESRTVGVRGGRLRRVLGKQRLSELLSCGNDATGTPLADQHQVTLTALSRVTPGAPGQSVVVTQVVATARSVTQSTDPVRCASTGRLETALNARAAERGARSNAAPR